jgi:DNA-directed RNA polymerase sigma subunit (sigma70/sigma32)
VSNNKNIVLLKNTNKFNKLKFNKLSFYKKNYIKALKTASRIETKDKQIQMPIQMPEKFNKLSNLLNLENLIPNDNYKIKKFTKTKLYNSIQFNEQLLKNANQICFKNQFVDFDNIFNDNLRRSIAFYNT